MNYNNYRATNELAVITKWEAEAIENAYRLSTNIADDNYRERVTDDFNRAMNLMNIATEAVLRITNPIYV